LEFTLQYFDIIIFAVLAGYLGIKLYRTLGRNTKIENHPSNEKFMKNTKDEVLNKKPEVVTEKDSAALKGEGLDYLRNIQPNFDEKNFLLGANKAYEMIIEAKNEGNKKFLLSLLEDDVFRSFEKEILDREIKGNIIEATKVKVSRSEITDCKVDNNIAYLTVNFNYEIGTLIKASDGSVVSDNLKELDEFSSNWIFSRALDSEDPNWKLYSI
tara:strand:+ start:1458 stop:2096 length:639 start_codon:yes stop_codon:yes gene_type:complete